MNNGNSPYSTGFNDKNIKLSQGSVDDQISMYKHDEIKQKSDMVLPHELEGIDKMLGDTFVSLTNIRNKITSAQQNKELNQHVLDNIKEQIDIINKIVLDIPNDLAKIGI